MIHTRKIVIDVNVDFPDSFTPEKMAMLIRDYLHVFRFSSSIAEISVYPVNTRVVQQPISLASNLPDTKN